MGNLKEFCLEKEGFSVVVVVGGKTNFLLVVLHRNKTLFSSLLTESEHQL